MNELMAKVKTFVENNLKYDENLEHSKKICEFSERYDISGLIEKVGKHLLETHLNWYKHKRVYRHCIQFQNQ